VSKDDEQYEVHVTVRIGHNVVWTLPIGAKADEPSAVDLAVTIHNLAENVLTDGVRGMKRIQTLGRG
jgi:hypothetical protein